MLVTAKYSRPLLRSHSLAALQRGSGYKTQTMRHPCTVLPLFLRACKERCIGLTALKALRSKMPLCADRHAERKRAANRTVTKTSLPPSQRRCFLRCCVVSSLSLSTVLPSSCFSYPSSCSCSSPCSCPSRRCGRIACFLACCPAYLPLSLFLSCIK